LRFLDSLTEKKRRVKNFKNEADGKGHGSNMERVTIPTTRMVGKSEKQSLIPVKKRIRPILSWETKCLPLSKKAFGKLTLNC
jgi:ATP-dependent phosphoenolpyruvate carboxykinase